MNLMDAKNNVNLKVINITKGQKAQMRLDKLGIVRDVIIKKISQQLFQGPITLIVKNSKVTIGQGLAMAIQVEETLNKEKEED